MVKNTVVTILLAMLLSSTNVRATTETDMTRNEIEHIIEQYLLNKPEILAEMSNRLREKRVAEQVNEDKANLQKYQDKLFKSAQSPQIGNAKGKIHIVEFFDYNCRYCKESAEFSLKAAEQNKDVLYVFKEHPILSDTSTYAAKAALAAYIIEPKKYLAFHKALMSNKGSFSEEVQIQLIAKQVGLNWEAIRTEMDSERVKKQLEENRNLAKSLKINGTPAFIIGDQILRGSPGSSEELNKLIAQARQKQK